MRLSGLLPLLEDAPSYLRLVRSIRDRSGGNTAAVPESARAYVISALHTSLAAPVFVLTSASTRARQLAEEIAVWVGTDENVLLLPAPDALPYERLSPDPQTVQQTLMALYTLDGGRVRPLLIACAYAAASRLTDRPTFRESCHIVQVGGRMEPGETIERWLRIGYEMEELVDRYATLSRRGGILDIYSPNYDLPARIELLGNTVESIRFFDPGTQRSVKPVERLAVVPASQITVPAAELAARISSLDSSGLQEDAAALLREDIERLSSHQRVPGMEFYSPLINDGSIAEYLPEGTLVVLDEPETIQASLQDLDDQASDVRRSNIERGRLPPDFPVPYHSWKELERRLGESSWRWLSLSRWGDSKEHIHLDLGNAPDYNGRLLELAEELSARGQGKRRTVIVSNQAHRLSELLAEQDTFALPVEELTTLPQPGSLSLVKGSLARGWTLSDSAGARLITDIELFGVTKEPRAVGKRPARHDGLLAELSPGDYVVHVDHGIGRFEGMTKKEVDLAEREYIVLQYAASDRLYVPSDQVDRIARYVGPGGYAPSLTRLGTQEWSRTKQRVRDAAGELARSLLALYSARETVPGIQFGRDTVWQQELEASFPYVETRDQLEAIHDVKRDMESARPMDRLVCGDVGYGKTEVALRSAFKAVMDGSQVAVLVPTTVLAQQHYRTFTERTAAFPLTIEQLSRFRSPADQQRVVEGLRSGGVDICIGTHRLLQKDIDFKGLGLVIIDEEQRFGVAHKERLKQMRREVDVLTLSATPIPRTLHMSLVGVRDLSNVETAPEQRLAIKTMVGPYEERLVREAIVRELERGGQVFYVHNRVNRIGRVAREVQQLVPEATVAVAHGQMREDSLESAMVQFAKGEVDVLVCTTIIESGLDLPNVNTLIVDDADRMGLTQLYQLRGRVGRGSNRAHAYFLYPRGKRLTDNARKRLETIYEAAELGAGFRIAMKDLEIRGAGNLLGPEQSGHMGAVGFDLYSRLLAEEVARIKGEKPRMSPAESTGTTVDLPLSALIPESYVPDLNTRLELYMRLSRTEKVEDVASFREELRDRFGEFPEEVDRLLYVVTIKLLGTQAEVQEVYVDSGQVVIRFGPETRLDRHALGSRFGPDVRVGRTQVRINMTGREDGWRETVRLVLEALATDARLSPSGS